MAQSIFILNVWDYEYDDKRHYIGQVMPIKQNVLGYFSSLETAEEAIHKYPNNLIDAYERFFYYCITEVETETSQQTHNELNPIAYFSYNYYGMPIGKYIPNVESYQAIHPKAKDVKNNVYLDIEKYDKIEFDGFHGAEIGDVLAFPYDEAWRDTDASGKSIENDNVQNDDEEIDRMMNDTGCFKVLTKNGVEYPTCSQIVRVWKSEMRNKITYEESFTNS